MPYADKERQRAYRAADSKKRKSRVDDYKNNKPCADCGMRYPYYVMQFDHLRDKKFGINKIRSHSWEKVLEEISKCDLVCANCHAIRTFNRCMGP